MSSEDRKFREAHSVPKEGWSDWYRAVVPDEGVTQDWAYTKRNPYQPGYYCNSLVKNLEKRGEETGKTCGIYEWRAVRERKRYVVYIGCTYRNARMALKERVMEYCRDGSHISTYFNRALRNGYEMHVRVKETGCKKKKAEDEENIMLATYNYAWNTRQNSPRRDKHVPPKD